MITPQTLDVIHQIQLTTSNMIEKEKLIDSGENKSISLKDKNNISKSEHFGLQNLKNNPEIIIKEADKGCATVIMNKVDYIREAERQLNNEKYYLKLKASIAEKNVPKIKTTLTKMNKEGFITKDQLKYLSGPDLYQNRTFYLLPKIHKDVNSWPIPNKMPEGRPIVSDVDSETYRISEYIESFINPLSTNHKSYLKNTQDFISKIQNKEINNDYLIVTGDISALYTNMNINRTINVVKKAFQLNPVTHRPDKYLLELLELCLKNNDFEFNEQYFLQIMGTAMGKRFAPSLANLYLIDLDNAAMNDFKIKPLLFFRYLDDIFFIWPGTVESLKEYEIFLNSLIPDIKIKLEYDKEKNNFLDTTIYKKHCKENSTLQTCVYFKPTDTHQLLHTASYHPRHTFKGILKSQLLRFKRISSTKDDFDKTCKILFHSLKQRGYTRTMMRDLKKNVWFNNSSKNEKNNQTQNDSTRKQILPITLDYGILGQKLAREYKKLLQNNELFKDYKIVIAYKNSKNLKNFLVRSRMKSGTISNKPIGAGFKFCTKATCQTCRDHAIKSKQFKSETNESKFNIRQKLSCNSSNLIYLITCQKCKLQYVGETGRTLHQRLTNHRSDIKTHKKTSIGIHFNTINHSLRDLKIVPIEGLSTNKGTNFRKSREKFWQQKLNTKYPHGLNCFPID